MLLPTRFASLKLSAAGADAGDVLGWTDAIGVRKTTLIALSVSLVSRGCITFFDSKHLMSVND